MEILKITRDIASKASAVYAVSWKTAYKNIVPQKYLDEISFGLWTPLLLDSSRAGYVLKVDDDFIAASSIAPAREEKMSGWGELISIYVLPQYFNQGYGKKLLEFVVGKLRKRGYDNIYLWVLEENQGARRFYERNGFSPNGDRRTITVGGKELVEARYVQTIK